MSEIFRIQWDIICVKDENNEKSSTEIILYQGEVLEALDKAASIYGAEAKQILFSSRASFKKENFFPWAYICLDKEYSIYHHLNALRENRQDFRMSSYSVIAHGKNPNEFSPAVSMLFFRSRTIFEYYAGKSLLLKLAWKDLGPRSKGGCWLLMMDPLPDDWVREHRD
jgi:hypothetical protein